MFSIILYQPEIPPNTGNIIRLCANTGAHLHLIHPLGFNLEDKQMRRAGLDYHEYAHIKHHDNYQSFSEKHSQQRIFACSTKGTTTYSDISYQAGDMFMFGPETRGLPADIISGFTEQQIIRIPMLAEQRSLNLSNSAAVIVYEAWRQLEFAVK